MVFGPLKDWWWVFVGGGTGSVLRYLMQNAVSRRWGNVFPWGTLSVNLLGALCMGALFGFLSRFGAQSQVKLALATGILGGFTTYSAFNQETLTLLQGGDFLRATLYCASTVIGALGLGAVGFLIGKI